MVVVDNPVGEGHGGAPLGRRSRRPGRREPGQVVGELLCGAEVSVNEASHACGAGLHAVASLPNALQDLGVAEWEGDLQVSARSNLGSVEHGVDEAGTDAGRDTAGLDVQCCPGDERIGEVDVSGREGRPSSPSMATSSLERSVMSTPSVNNRS